MSKNVKIILFSLISLSMLGLVLYGLFYSKKLDSQKETSVDSNIDEYLYDETKDTLDTEEEEEDLDGDEAVVEDDDFEVYDEEDDWGDEEESNIETATATATATTRPKPKEKKVEDEDGELEELYDNNPSPKEEPKPIEEEAPIEDIPAQSNFKDGKYLVVVGSFGSTTNAKRKIKALEKAGFEGEIIQFEGSKLNTVIAGRFAKQADADQLAQEIKDKKLNAIVKEE